MVRRQSWNARRRWNAEKKGGSGENRLRASSLEEAVVDALLAGILAADVPSHTCEARASTPTPCKTKRQWRGTERIRFDSQPPARPARCVRVESHPQPTISIWFTQVEFTPIEETDDTNLLM